MREPTPWPEDAPASDYPALRGPIDVDVCIIGGGITGVTAAYLLAKDGATVALVEQGRIGHGTTAAMTAHATMVTDAPLSELAQTFGLRRAALAWRAGAEAVDQMGRMITDEGIDCDFVRCPAYVFARDAVSLTRLEREAELATRLGFDARMQQADLGFFAMGYMGVDARAKLHPLKYLNALADRASGLGAMLYENSKVLWYEDGPPCRVLTEAGEVRCQKLFLATHVPLHDPKLLSMKIDAFQTYVIEAQVRSGLLPEGIFWDTEKPYHYFRVDRRDGFDRLIVGGEDHRTGQDGRSASRYLRLRHFVHELLGEERYAVTREWSGEVLETVDGLPYIGSVGDGVFVATGYAGNGMTFGTQAALLFRDFVHGRSSELAELFRPGRRTGWRRAWSRLRSVARGMIGGRLRRGKRLADLRPGEGAIVEDRGRKAAAYRSPQGVVTKLSPVCTHMGCIVGWNDAGKTWDCPCHGSRYSPDGSVVNGPAERPLEQWE